MLSVCQQSRTGSNYYLNMYFKSNRVAVKLMAYHIIAVSCTRLERKRLWLVKWTLDLAVRGRAQVGVTVYHYWTRQTSLTVLHPGVEKGQTAPIQEREEIIMNDKVQSEQLCSVYFIEAQIQRNIYQLLYFDIFLYYLQTQGAYINRRC